MASSPLKFSLVSAVLALAPLPALAQGTIYGALRNADMSIPADSSVQFFGFTDNMDEEIHVSGSIGAAYENGFWYDDFQNFMSATVGHAYRFYFFNLVDSEYALLSKTIPNNSFELQNVNLTPGARPDRPSNLTARRTGGGGVNVAWDPVDGETWHLYRRSGSSEGSFFRVDDPLGRLTSHGLTSPGYFDAAPGDEDSYTYVVIAEDQGGQYSPPSEAATVTMHTCCVGRVGDANQKGGDEPTLGDISLLISYLFIYNDSLPCLAEADINQSGGADPTYQDITVGDILLLIDYLFVSGRPLPPCIE